jgi:threonine aldolase
MRRRSFFAAPLAASLAPMQAAPAASDDRVYATGDGIPHTPEEYARLLVQLAESGKVTADEYSRGGIVEKLESRMAEILGKEAAVWLPTGTLANHLAVRLPASTRRRVLVQAESHLYNDCGDCCQTLSGLNLIGLARGQATFTLDDVERASREGATGRVATSIGAIQIETPVRRRSGEAFDFAEMKKIAAWARERSIAIHLDGARIFIESAYTARPVKEYAALADTVYVSMYKYFNAASGAILAGPKTLLADLYHVRRMFGAGLSKVWPFAAVALHYIEGFEGRFRTAVQNSERVIEALSKDGNFEVQRVARGTNVFRMRPTSVNPPVYQLRLETAGVTAAVPVGEWFTMHVNETWLRIGPDEIVGRLRKALG